MMNLILMAALFALVGLFLFGVIAYPIWTLIHCAISNARSRKSKAWWIVGIFLFGPLGATVYGLFGAQRKLFKWISGLLLCAVVILFVSLFYLLNTLGNIARSEINMSLGRLSSYNVAGLDPQELEKLSKSLLVLQVEAKSSIFDFNRMSKVSSLIQLFNIMERDGKLTATEYKDWMSKFEERNIIGRDMLQKYVRNYRPDLAKYGYTKESYANDKIKRLNGAISANPSDANNYFSRGMIYANNLHFNEALDDFLKALSLNPDLPIANNYVGFIYIMQEKYDSAEQYCKKAVEQSPNFSKPYFNLARIYQHRNDFDGAIEYVTKAIGLEQNFYEGYILRSDIFLEKKEFAKSIEDLQKAILLNAPNTSSLQAKINEIQGLLDKEEKR